MSRSGLPLSPEDELDGAAGAADALPLGVEPAAATRSSPVEGEADALASSVASGLELSAGVAADVSLAEGLADSAPRSVAVAVADTVAAAAGVFVAAA